MTSKLNKALRKQFDQTMQKRLPQFEPYRPPVPCDSRTYRWIVNPNLTFFVILNSYNKGEAFTLNLAWTPNPDISNEFPYPTFDPFDDRDPKGVYFRITSLLGKTPQRDGWWDFAPPGPDENSLDGSYSLEMLDAMFSIRDPAQLSFQESPRLIVHSDDKLRDAFVESARSLVPLAVDQAIDKIEQYAMPYFEQIAEKHAQKGG